MADQSVPLVQNPYDCIERAVHKLRPDEMRLVLAAINYYVVVKTGEAKQEALNEYLAGTWIERATTERGLSEDERVALAINEGTRALWGWLDKEPCLANEDEKRGAGLLIAQEAMKETFRRADRYIPRLLHRDGGRSHARNGAGGPSRAARQAAC